MFEFFNKMLGKSVLAEAPINPSSGVMKGELTAVQRLFNQYFKYLQNPDDILNTKSYGKPLSKLYDTMIDSDPHLASLINTRKLALLGLKYRIEPFIDELSGATEPTRRDKQIAQEVAWALGQIKKFKNSLSSSLSAFDHGYSVCEFIWEFMDGKYVPVRIKHRKPEYFKFDADDNLIFVSSYGKEELMPSDKFMVLTHNEKYSDPYGNALCKSAYWPSWFKTTLIKFMLTFSEKLGMPTVEGSYPTGTWSDDQKREFLAQLQSIQNNSCMIHPDDTTVALLESAARKEADFITALEFFNAEQSKIVLGQTLTSEPGKSGSYSLGQVHNDVREDILIADAEWWGDGLTDNLVGAYVRVNYGPTINWPKLRVIVPKKKDLLNDSTTLNNLVSNGLEVGEKYVREHYEIPAPEPGEKILAKVQIQVPTLPNNDNANFSEKHNHKSRIRLAYKTKIPPGAKTYDRALSASYYDRLYEFMIGIFADIESDILTNLSPGRPIAGLIDQAVRQVLGRGEFKSGLSQKASDAAFSIAKNIAMKFNASLSEQAFQKLSSDYMMNRFYQKGTINGISQTFRELLGGSVQDWGSEAIGYDIGKMKAMLQNTFKDMAEWKADQIARTEIKEAANYASFEVIDKAGLSDVMEAYFITDPDSCDICQEWASNNPYSYEAAQGMGLPHIGCNDQWSFAIKGESQNE